MFLIVIVSLFVGVVSAEAIIIDTEKGEPGFWTEPARDLPANWWYVQDHLDSSADGWFVTKAYPPGQGNGSFWYTIAFPGMDECKGIWETSLPHSGEYEVFAWIPSPDHFDPYLDESTPPHDYLPTKRATYKIFHDNGVTTVTIDQNEGGFTSFGVFDFDSTARVELSSNGVEFWRSVAFDAVTFVPTTKGIPKGTLREVDVVKHLEWAGPEGTRPDTYAEYIACREYEGKKEPIITLDASTRYIILVDNGELHNNILSELIRYMDEVIATGYDAEIGYYQTGSPSPEDIRSWLQTQQPFAGCLLIGDLSSAWFELDSSSWPIDLFFMDLNGIWTDSDLDGIYDSHTGNVAPEIFVARLKSDNLFLGGSTEVDLLKNYFDKNHNYRLGLINQPKRGLMYVDDDWVPWANNWNAALGLVYDHTTLVKDKDTTIDTDYENRLSHGYEWIPVCAHSWPGGHHFKNTAGWDGYTYNTEIKSIDPDAFFYNLFACSGTRFTMDDYLGGWYIFTNTYGLTAVGSTKTGSMLEFDHFYGPLGQGNTIGDAFLQWFKEVGVTDVYWFYGMNILGDPLLKPVSEDTAVFRNGRWWVSKPDHSGTDYSFNYGIPGDIPVVGDI